MGTTSTLQPRPRHGARLIQVALGGYFMAFGAGLVPGKDVRVLTQHLAEAPLDSLVAAALICPIALLVIMGRLYTPALIALIAAFVAVARPEAPSLPANFSDPAWVDAALLATMVFALFLGQPRRAQAGSHPRLEPTAPIEYRIPPAPKSGPRLLNQPTVRLRRGMGPTPQGKGLNIFRDEFLGN